VHNAANADAGKTQYCMHEVRVGMLKCHWYVVATDVSRLAEKDEVGWRTEDDSEQRRGYYI
jgi:hypothetical protein